MLHLLHKETGGTIMDNYEAIKKMSKQQLENFLDGVYCTGLNDDS